MESTLFTTLTATEEASLSGGNKPAPWKHKPPVKKPPAKPTPPTTPTTPTTTTTNTLVNITTIVVGPTIAIAGGKDSTAVAIGPVIKLNQKA